MTDIPAITLFQPPTRPWKTPNLSPFCNKLETYLRFAKIPHEVRTAVFPKAPKGKIPYVQIGSELMGDSQLIIERLEALSSPGLDHALTAQQRALSQAVRRMLDEGFYFVLLYHRWNSEHTHTHQREEFVKVLPAPLRMLFSFIVRDVRKKLKDQGTGRHTLAEVGAMGIRDMDAISALLGDNKYLHGDTPTTVDASVFASVSSTLGFPGDSALKAHVMGLKNLVAYRDRIMAEYWKELL
jgi:glutathione S-transferase